MSPKPGVHFIIGNIHGCYEELLRLEDQIGIRCKKEGVSPNFVSVGDLIDRGPNSFGVVEHFVQNSQNHEAVIGNHELLMLEALLEFSPQQFENLIRPGWLIPLSRQFEWRKGLAKNLLFADYRILRKCLWLGNGGYETLNSYGLEMSTPEKWILPVHHLEFLLSRRLVWRSPNVIVTHALAIADDVDLFEKLQDREDQDSQSARSAATQSIIWNRDIHSFKKFPVTHVSGHTPFKKVKKYRHQNALVIDTGCVYGDRLTAYSAETGKTFQVDSNFNWA